jgi:hypothetical protein
MAVVARGRDVTTLHLASNRDAKLSSHLLLISDVLLALGVSVLAMVARVLLRKVGIVMFLLLEWRIVVSAILEERFVSCRRCINLWLVSHNLVLIRRDIETLSLDGCLAVARLTTDVGTRIAGTALLEVLLDVLLGGLGAVLALVVTLAVVVHATAVVLGKVRLILILLLLEGRVVVDLILTTALVAPAIVTVVRMNR